MRNARSRALLTAVGGVALLALLAACASANSTPSSSSSGAKVTLTLGNSQWLDAIRGKNLWAAMLKYEKVNPNVTLQQEAISSADFTSKITTELGAGQGPDIIMMQDGLFASEAAAGALVPLTSVKDSAKSLNATNSAGVYDGTQYGMAWQRATYGLVYNKTLLKEAGISSPPTTVVQLITDAKQVKAKTGAVGFATRASSSDPNWYLDFENWIDGFGGSITRNGKVDVDTAANVEAVTEFKKMYDSGILDLGDDMTTSRTRFEAGKVGFVLDSSGGTLNMALGGSVKSDEVGVAPVPFPGPGAHQQILVTVNKNSKNQKAAVAFVKWLMSPAGQQALRDASGPDTLATNVPLTASFLKTSPWGQEFVKLAPASKSVLIPGYEAKTAAIMAPVMNAVEQVLLSNANPATALKSAQSQAAAAAK